MSVSQSAKPIQVVFPIFDGADLLDIAGPFALLSSAAGIQPILASADGCPITTWQGARLEAQTTLDAVNGAPVCWVPGGSGDSFHKQIDHHAPAPQWLHANRNSFNYVVSVCTGAFVVGASGLLNGYTVTTHWMFQHEITMFPGVKLASGFPRYWIDGNRITGGGVSSGLDQALALVAILTNPDNAMKVQLTNQYDPNPPYNSGTPVTAPPQVMGAYFAGDPNPGLDMRNTVAHCLATWNQQRL
jgi:cyclohexyl-isocyanide hydratase